tara:strand:+ start:117 stop:464 length:348 start_codon:yes stop_codon:yes gene_type:complete
VELVAELQSQSCEACKIDAPRLTDTEITNLISEINDWDLIQEPVKQIKKIFSFPDYQSGVNFLNAVATMADQEDHHPELVLEWGKVTVIWWSHKIKGLHKNDFICASKTDNLYQN